MSAKINYSIPVRTYSKLNAREHWAVKAKRSAAERQWAKLCTPASVKSFHNPLRVTLIRCGPKTLDDDNLAGSQKAIRDGIAHRIGIDDGSALIQWIYAQKKSKRYETEVTIEEIA